MQQAEELNKKNNEKVLKQQEQINNNYRQLAAHQAAQAHNQKVANAKISNANITRNKANKAVNELAQKGLQSVGVPKALSNKIVNSKLGQKAMQKGMDTLKKKVPAFNIASKLFDSKNSKSDDNSKPEVSSASDQQQFESSSGEIINIKLVIKLAVIFTPILVVVIFCCLIITSSNVYLKAVGLSHADSVSNSDAEEKINNQIEKHPDDMEVKDEDASLDFFIDENAFQFRTAKLNRINLVP